MTPGYNDKAEAGGSKVQGQPKLQGKLQVILD